MLLLLLLLLFSFSSSSSFWPRHLVSQKRCRWCGTVYLPMSHLPCLYQSSRTHWKLIIPPLLWHCRTFPRLDCHFPPLSTVVLATDSTVQATLKIWRWWWWHRWPDELGSVWEDRGSPAEAEGARLGHLSWVGLLQVLQPHDTSPRLPADSLRHSAWNILQDVAGSSLYQHANITRIKISINSRIFTNIKTVDEYYRFAD